MVVDSPTIADPGLTELGEWQAARLADWLVHEDIDHVVTSPKRRAIETAQAICDAKGLANEVVDDFDEIDRLCHSYYPTEILQTEGKAIWDQVLAGNFTEVGWDTPEVFNARVRAAWEDLCRRMPGKRVLVVLVVNRSEVQNRIIHTDRDYDEAELRQAANYINHTYGGCDLNSICDGLLNTMNADRAQMDVLMRTAMEVADKALRSEPESSDYVVSGESNLLKSAEADNLHQLRDLFDAFNHKRDILHLLERSMKADGVQIFIGRESGFQPFEDYSLISAPYKADNGPVGVLAVVGPTRMDYEKVIPTVDITAKILSAALTQL